MTDAEARAKAEEAAKQLADSLVNTITDQRCRCASPHMGGDPCFVCQIEAWEDEIAAALREPLAALLRDAGAGAWSKERPTKPGQYWVRSFVKPEAEWHVVCLFYYDDEIGEGLFVKSQGDECTDPVTKWEGCEWSGPIPEPR